MFTLKEAQKKLEEHQIDVSLAIYLKRYLERPEDFEQAIHRLIQCEPVQYIVGKVPFYHTMIEVNKNVLIPRFETEELVEKTITRIRRMKNKRPHILDLGTGSGCIAIALKKEIPEAFVDAVDLSKEALSIAQKNAIQNGTKINFYEGNLLEPITRTYDVIISNPPYIADDEEIMEIVYQNEPHMALYAPQNGQYFYREILKNVFPHLEKNSMIAFEIGSEQGQPLLDVAKAYFPEATITIEQDLQGRDRFLFIERGETD